MGVCQIGYTQHHESILLERGEGMEKEECSISPEGLEQLLTIPEVAKLIGASYGQTAMILQRKRVPTRWATVEEEAMLLLAGRIEPVPPRPGFPPGADRKE